MRSRLQDLLPVVITAIVGGLVCWGIEQIYVIPWIFPDSFTYLEAAKGNPAVAGFHTPVFGWLMHLTARWSYYPIIWLQMGLWIGCAVMIVRTLQRRGATPYRAMIGGMLFIAIEIYVAHTLHMNAFVLTDALCAELTLLGLLLLFEEQSSIAMITGAALVSFGNTMRPVMAGVGAALCAVMILLRLGIITRKMTLVLLLALVLPTAALCISNRIVYGSFAPSSQMGFFMLGKSVALAKPEDRIFEENELNHAFHQAIETGSPPKGHAGWDTYLLEKDPDYAREHALASFYASLLKSNGRPDFQRFLLASVSNRIAWKLFALHPAESLRLFLQEFLYVALPDRSVRKQFSVLDGENLSGYTGALYEQMQLVTAVDGMTLQEAMSRSNAGVMHMMDTESLRIRLPERVGIFTMIIAALLLCSVIFVIVRGWKFQKAYSLLSWTILILMTNSLLQAGMIAAITTLHDSRYRLPGILTSEAAVIMALVVLTQHCFRRHDLVESTFR